MSTNSTGETTAAPQESPAAATTDLVDAHHHIWRMADLPWVSGEMLPRIFGPYESIRADYLAQDYVAEATACGITSAVYVQANWPLDRSLDEIRWLRDVHAETGWPMAFIGSADLFDPGAADVLRQQAAISPLVRGTRLQLHWHEHPPFRFASAPDRMHDPVFRRNIATLADLGWLFELQVFAPQMADAARFVADFPDIPFVLVHAGMLESSEPAAVQAWRRGLRLLAEQPNVLVKLTGQGTFVHRVDQDLIDMVAGTCLDLFGSRRCMWGTNFPIEKIWTELPPLVAAWRQALSGQSPQVQADVFAATARRVYSL
jgi:predicted TIM-barrel fold metal-dependent hydrolase